MANFDFTVTSNSFKTKDNAKVKELLEQQELDVHENSDGTLNFASYDSIPMLDEELNEYEEDSTTLGKELQSLLLTPIVFKVVGNEKLRYNCGTATIITKDSIEYLDLDDMVQTRLKELS